MTTEHIKPIIPMAYARSISEINEADDAADEQRKADNARDALANVRHIEATPAPRCFVALIEVTSLSSSMMSDTLAMPSNVDMLCEALEDLGARFKAVLGIVRIPECDSFELAQTLIALGFDVTRCPPNTNEVR